MVFKPVQEGSLHGEEDAVDDCGQAYTDAVVATVDEYLDKLPAHTKLKYCSPDGREERKIGFGHEGEAFIVARPDHKVLIDNIRDKAAELGQHAPNDEAWAGILANLDVEVERIILKNTDGGIGSPILGVSTGVALGTIFAGPTFGLSLVVGGLAGSMWGVNKQEKKQRAARDCNREKEAAVLRKAISEIRARKQKIVDAIMACNY